MPTARSWTEPGRRAAADVGHLLAFRQGTVRRPRALLAGLAVLVVLTAAAAVLPHLVAGAGTGPRALAVRDLLGSAWAGFLLLAVVSALASGGGHQLLGRDEGVAFPVSATTDHLGALLVAPLNLAWLLPAWLLLASAAYGVGDPLGPAQVGTVLWLGVATAVGQAVAWSVETLRRRPRGTVLVRSLAGVVVAGAVMLHLTGRLGTAADAVPTGPVVAGLLDGWSPRGVLTVLGLAIALMAAVALGVLPAHRSARLPSVDTQRVETRRFPTRVLPASDWSALVRTDRASIWRAVPVRRGVAVLALGPGAIALLGRLDWPTLTVLPGLIVAGGALLFAVNAWCLDGRGMLWRESLPVTPGRVFAARAWTLTEFLVLVSVVTLVVAGVRAGMPQPTEVTALVCTWVVVVTQVVGAAMRWSARAPYAEDLRSARSAPAPPVAMVSYAARLAAGTTFTSLVFAGLARTDHPGAPVLAAVPFLMWSSWRLRRTYAAWCDPAARARVAVAVAG